MIRSITLIRFKDGTDERTREAVRQAYLELPAHIPGLLSIEPGLDLGLLEGTAHLAVIALFATKQDFLAYSQHPAQAEVIFPVCGPVLADWQTLQHEFVDRAFMETYYAAYNSEDPARLRPFYHPDVELHSAQGVLRGAGEILRTYGQLTTMFRDRMTPERIDIRGTTAVVDICDRLTAKQDVPDFMGTRLQTGEQLELRFRGTYELQDGAFRRIHIALKEA
jgi:ketosteroid isomerase-like protein